MCDIVIDLKRYQKFIKLYRELPFDYEHLNLPTVLASPVDTPAAKSKPTSTISPSFQNHDFFPDKRIGGAKNPRTVIDKSPCNNI
jgi:hypothetical protein